MLIVAGFTAILEGGIYPARFPVWIRVVSWAFLIVGSGLILIQIKGEKKIRHSQ